MITKNILKSEKAQSMVEVAIMLPIFLLLIGGIIHFGRVYVLKQRTLAAARYLTWKKANGQEVDAKLVADFYFDGLADNLQLHGVDADKSKSINLGNKMSELNNNEEISGQMKNNQTNPVPDDSESEGILSSALSYAGISIGLKNAGVSFEYKSSFMRGKSNTTLEDHCAVYNNYNPESQADAEQISDQVGTFKELE